MFQHWRILQYNGVLRGFLGSVEDVDDSALEITEGTDEIFETVLFEEIVEFVV